MASWTFGQEVAVNVQSPELIATTLRFSSASASPPSHRPPPDPATRSRSSDSRRESEQPQFRLAPHGNSKVAWQFRAGSERSGGLRLLSPQRQRFLRPGRFRFISNINILLVDLPAASTRPLHSFLPTPPFPCFCSTSSFAFFRTSSLMLVLVQHLSKG